MLNILRQIYLNSFLYDKKISKTNSKILSYKPSSHLLSSIVNIQKKRTNVNNFSLETVWVDKKLTINKLIN